MPDFNSNLPNAKARAEIAWKSDGVPRLVNGLRDVFIASTVLVTYFWRLQSLSVSERRIFSLFCFFILPLMYSLFEEGTLLKWLKGRLTSPRIGYVNLRDPAFDELAPALGSSVPSILRPQEVPAVDQSGILVDSEKYLTIPFFINLFTFFAIITVDDSWICLVLALAYVWLSWTWYRSPQSMISRIEIFSLPMFWLLIFLSPAHDAQRFWLFLIGVGILKILEGSYQLVRFMRANPPVRRLQ